MKQKIPVLGYQFNHNARILVQHKFFRKKVCTDPACGEGSDKDLVFGECSKSSVDVISILQLVTQGEGRGQLVRVKACGNVGQLGRSPGLLLISK